MPKLTNEISIDIVKTMGIDIRFAIIPFIKKGCKFSSRYLCFVACHHIVASNKLVIITREQ